MSSEPFDTKIILQLIRDHIACEGVGDELKELLEDYVCDLDPDVIDALDEYTEMKGLSIPEYLALASLNEAIKKL